MEHDVRVLCALACLFGTPFTLAACGSDEKEVQLPPPGVGTGACAGLPLPQGAYYVSSNLCVGAVALRQEQLRQLTFASNGDLLGVRVPGTVLRYRDLDSDGFFAGTHEIVEIADTHGSGNNVAFDDNEGFLYAGTPDGVKRWSYSSSSTNLGSGEEVVIGEPSSGTHVFHTVHVYDGILYVHSGSENNAVAPASPEYDTHRAVLKRFILSEFTPGTPFDWETGELVVVGIRNMVGFTRNAAGAMYGVINGIDDLMYGGLDVHKDNPGDDLIRIESGGRHGYPYCFSALNIVRDGTQVEPGTQLASATNPEPPDPDFVNPHDDAWCAENSEAPVTSLPAHSAPLDITFLDAATGALAEEWEGGAFVSLHGSWDTTPSIGHQVVWVPFGEEGTAERPQADATGVTFPFRVVFGGGNAEGPSTGAWGWKSGDVGEQIVRPVGVAVSPRDGALYVSSDDASVINGPGSDEQGAIYRIARGAAR
jgi:glucose/arabinose dehydrogenase